MARLFPQELPTPAPGRVGAEAFVSTHLSHLISGQAVGSPVFPGGQRAADAALASFDVASYSVRRNEVWPPERRGASQLSPYIRHGLLTLPEVWDATAQGPSRDVQKFHDELLWQEFARHWYARLGAETKHGVRRELPASGPADAAQTWDRSMACLDLAVTELGADGWLVNQTRMWLSSHWAIRSGARWQDGEDEFFRHLLDGSRAANRLGWQWTTGVGSSKHYGFSRWQVNKRAPGLCDHCDHRHACPIEDWPDDPTFVPASPHAGAEVCDPTMVAGPASAQRSGDPKYVWLTAESLGTRDPALQAYSELPAVFVFDEPLLRRLQLSAKRLVFLTEALAEIAEERDLFIVLDDPVDVLHDTDVAVTFAPVPGFARRSAAIGSVSVQPWPWLVRPGGGSVASFSAWRRSHPR